MGKPGKEQRLTTETQRHRGNAKAPKTASGFHRRDAKNAENADEKAGIGNQKSEILQKETKKAPGWSFLCASVPLWFEWKTREEDEPPRHRGTAKAQGRKDARGMGNQPPFLGLFFRRYSNK